jgi:hypothetical protein
MKEDRFVVSSCLSVCLLATRIIVTKLSTTAPVDLGHFKKCSAANILQLADSHVWTEILMNYAFILRTSYTGVNKCWLTSPVRQKFFSSNISSSRETAMNINVVTDLRF